MEKPKRRKKPLLIVLIVLIVLMLIPIPLSIKDGGSILLQAVLYRAWIYNSMPEPIPDEHGDFVVDDNGEYVLERFKGVVVEIPGFLDEGWEIIDTARWVPVEPNE